MIVQEQDVEIKKFKMFADKVDTEAQAIDLCKKYLKHKGIDIQSSINAALAMKMEPPKIEKHYVGLSDLSYVEAQYTIDGELIRGISRSAQEQMEYIIYARKSVTEMIMRELIKSDTIQFHEYKDMALDRTVVKGRLIVYKDPKYDKR